MYVPQVDGYLIVQVPNERLRAVIRKVVTEDAVITEITSIPLTRLHNYKLGDYVACRRKKDALGEYWEAVDEQKISLNSVAETKEEKPKIVKPKKKKKKNAVKTGIVKKRNRK